MCFIVKVLRGVPCGLLRVNSSAEDSFILVDKVENYRLCCRSILGPKAFLAPRFRECVQLAGTILLCTLRFKLMRILLYNPVGKKLGWMAIEGRDYFSQSFLDSLRCNFWRTSVLETKIVRDLVNHCMLLKCVCSWKKNLTKIFYF